MMDEFIEATREAFAVAAWVGTLAVIGGMVLYYVAVSQP